MATGQPFGKTNKGFLYPRKGKGMSEEIAHNETAAIQRYAALKASGEDTIGVSRVYIDMTGDWYAALILDELIYWTVPNKKRGAGLRVKRDGQLWLAVNRSEWWDRKRLTERQADGAIQKLVELGLVEKKVMLFNAKTTPHLRIIPSRFFQLYGEAMQEFLQDAEPDEKREIADLYEMMGLEKPAFYENVKPELRNGETYELRNGETINNPTLTNIPNCANAPVENHSPMPLDWQIASGANAIMQPTAEQEFTAKVDIACMAICHHGADLEPLARAFIATRKIFPSKKEAKGWASCFREMKQAGVTADGVRLAIQKLSAKSLTIASPFSIAKTAIADATPMTAESTAPAIVSGVFYG